MASSRPGAGPAGTGPPVGSALTELALVARRRRPTQPKDRALSRPPLPRGMTSFEGFRCADCGATATGEGATTCPDCNGALDATYDLDELVGGPPADRPGDLLPVAPVGMGEGETPLVEAPRLAEELDVGTLRLKDEGHNPTGSVLDRGMSLVAAAADDADADTLALATTGDAGQSAAAYAARAGLLSRVFVPSRANFINKAMINVHGGDMRVVEGRYGDARETYETEREELPAADAETWFPAGTLESPYRHEGFKPVYYETAAALGTAPDAVVVPVAHGGVVAAIWKAARELERLGVVDARPRVYAAQPDGCAPIVEAVEGGHDPEPWEVPDSTTRTPSTARRRSPSTRVWRSASPAASPSPPPGGSATTANSPPTTPSSSSTPAPATGTPTSSGAG
ncbi:threonine synthase [Halobacteriales archaeon QS_8_69_73]|nr:MAG: threonine synthase [Halobacteriales archaeon QS_8_69_73]